MDLKLYRKEMEKRFWSNFNSLELISQIPGTNSPRIQHLVNLAVSCLPDGEAYFEVGCLNGTSLDAANHNNENKIKYAMDIEIQGEMPRLIERMPNLYFKHGDFFKEDLADFLKHPIGVYYYDANHDYQPTVLALIKIIPYLADKAIIFMDDIHGYSRVYNAWRDFMRSHADQFTIVHEFWTPDEFIACTKGYKDGWWDGFAIAEFQREFERHDEDIESIAIARWHRIGKYSNKPRVLYPEELKYIHGREEEPC
jgi:hypothetical protein